MVGRRGRRTRRVAGGWPGYALHRVLLLRMLAVRGARFLLPRAAEAREVLPEALTAAGGRVEVVAAYRTLPPDPAEAGRFLELMAGGVDVAVFTASSTVRNLAGLFPGRPLGEVLSGAAVAVIGPVTARAAAEHGLTVACQAAEYTLDGLVAALVDWRRGRR